MSLHPVPVSRLRAGFNCLVLAALLTSACAQLASHGERPADPETAAIHTVIRSGNPSQLTHLLDAGADPNLRELATMRTPLAPAVLAGRKDQIVLLLRAGADPNLTDSVGNTALHIAAQTNQPWIALQLLEAGARPDTRNAQGKTFLAYFALIPDDRLSPDARDGKKAIVDWLARYGFSQDNCC